MHQHDPMMAAPDLPPPVAIGGLGGSGTRLVSEILRNAGIFMGSDLNAPGDNLWFTLLFKHASILEASDERFDQLLRAFVSAMTGAGALDDDDAAMLDGLARQDRPQHPSDWLLLRKQSLLTAAHTARTSGRWGWKEPNTHVVIERIWRRLPDLRYIHVVRHGLDMAYGRNQNQLRLWGGHFLGRSPAEDGPADSLAYWCRVQQRMEALLARNPHRIHWLDYDRLCVDPAPVLEDLARFLSTDAGKLVAPPAGIHRRPARHSGWATDDLAAADIEYVRSLGYAIDGSR